MLTFELYARGTNEDALQAYHAFFRRESDGFYYDPLLEDFSANGDAADYVEDPDHPGRWTLEITFAVEPTGAFTLIPWDSLTGYLLADHVQPVWLREGVPLPDYLRDQTALHADYGGTGALRLTHENGDPLEGAGVRVYTKAAYETNDLTFPWGVTVTDAYGQWQHPIFVNRGATYIVHFQKEGFAGPVTVEVIVP